MESFRKAYGALKDSTKVGLAKVNSEFKDLDIAIVKATNHVEHPPKERHVRKIFTAVSVACPRADVGYCIHALSKRLQKTRNWIVAIKSLIVFHRILRECDASFKEELLHITRRGNLFQISNFKDDSSPLAWDCSGWVRTYALFLEERLQCFRRLKYDIESDRALKKSSIKEERKFQMLNGEELLEQLPAMQQLLYRLICCQPEGAARYNYLVQYALALVVKESFKLYCAINDGIVSLVDTYFEMPKNEAVKALTIYKKAGRQAEHLADFYDFCRTLDLARTFQFPILRQPPPSFLATMEEYLKEAPLTAAVAQLRVEYREATKEAEITEEPAKEEAENEEEEDKNKQETEQQQEEAEPVIKQDDQPLISAHEPVDLLGLNEINPQALQLEESNALALAIVQPGSEPLTNNNALTAIGNTSGWELALVTAPSNTSKPQICHPNMAGGFDKLLLDSLYEDDAARRQSQLHNAGYSTSGYGYGPQNMFNQHDPFAMSNNIAPPTDVQMAMMAQQHQMVMQNQQQYQMMTMQHQQHNMMLPYNNTYPHQQMPQIGASNPFGDPFGYPAQSSMPPHGNHTLL